MPLLAEWLEGQRRRMTFHVTQVLSGRGCFGDYLCRIGKERTAQCHHCGGNLDSAQHKLEQCPAWADQRRVLVQIVGGELSLPAVMAAIIGRGRMEGLRLLLWNSHVPKKAEEKIRRGDQLLPLESYPNREHGAVAPPRRPVPRGRANIHPPIPAPPCGVG